MNIFVATGNQHKVKEFRIILEPLGFNVAPYRDFNKLGIVENGQTFEENAAIKAVALSQLAEMNGCYVLADDSGIAVQALDGAPGVHSARYAADGDENAADEANNALLLANMANVADRAAAFICVIALAKDGKLIKTFRGECHGAIANAPKGGNGFGYDPIFVLPNGKHMAEHTDDEKSQISHRHNALIKLYHHLQGNHG